MFYIRNKHLSEKYLWVTINVQKIKFAKAGMAESCSPKVDMSLKNSVKKTTLSFVSGPVLENSWRLHPVLFPVSAF